jgi:hypothetical protein
MSLNLEAATRKINERIQQEAEKTAKEMAKRADYKIQIWFRSTRSSQKPIAYTLSFWESGKRLHGGGDEMMFVCRRHEHAPKLSSLEIQAAKRKSLRGCDNLIPGGIAADTGLLVCPHCHARHKPDQVGDSIFYRTTVNQAADILANWWRKLGGKADLYAKYNPQDPRSIMMAQNYDYRTAREKKGLTIYPLQNILKDTLNGASLESRFKAFITA